LPTLFLLPAWLPAALLGLGGLAGLLTWHRVRRFPVLPDPSAGTGRSGPGGVGALPSVCLCIPARNEAPGVGPALDSWLAQDHDGLRILVLDDGSTDGTPALLADRARRHPGRLRVLRQEALPPGWLGKNHALHRLSREPEALAAEWLLLADADVHAAPDLLRRAFAFLEARPAGLLTLVPALDLGGAAERALLPPAMAMLLWLWPPEAVPDPASRAFCGIGAFMLVRRAAYDAAGGHAAAPLEPIDDHMLARRIKRAGWTGRVALGGRGLHFRAYPGLAAIVQGLRKNVLGLPGLWLAAPLLAPVLALLFLAPPLLILGGWPLAGAALWLLVPAAVALAHRRISAGGAEALWVLWPLGGLVLAAGMVRAFLDRVRGVNHWRGRSVPLGAGGGTKGSGAERSN
jgi:hypothetical protein